MGMISVLVIPRSTQNKMLRQADGTVRAWVTAPPVEGEANEAVRRLLAETLGVSRSLVSLKRGSKSRTKFFEVSGLGDQEIFERIPEVSR